MMGLVVVARLAARHGVKVELRSSAERGIIADVTLPTAVLVPRALAGRGRCPVAGAERRPGDRVAAAAVSAPPRSPLRASRWRWKAVVGSRLFDHQPMPSSCPPPVDASSGRSAAAGTGRRPGMPAWSDLTGAVNGLVRPDRLRDSAQRRPAAAVATATTPTAPGQLLRLADPAADRSRRSRSARLRPVSHPAAGAAVCRSRRCRCRRCRCRAADVDSRRGRASGLAAGRR